jgi:hypothetical protein
MNLKKILETHLESILKAQCYLQIAVQYTASQIVVYL